MDVCVSVMGVCPSVMVYGTASPSPKYVGSVDIVTPGRHHDTHVIQTDMHVNIEERGE